MAGLIPPTTLDQIRAASDIVDVIGAALPLKRAGTNFVALCPFHKEKSPSFNVNPQKQIFYCFGCHKGGDVFAFVRDYENLSFIEAVRRLAERAHIPLVMENNPAADQQQFVKETLLNIHEQITQRWQSALANEASGQIARDYLAKRGVSEEAVKLFRLGYAPEEWDDTVNWAKSKGFDLALVEKAGLVVKKEETGRHYDRFRGRLMFPICDEQGRVIGFSGRILSGDEKIAKYVNSPETPIFTKGKVFFGLDKSKRALLDAGRVIICEGQLDLIACYMAGIKNVVAPQGTALTGAHTRILKRYVPEVVLCFDSDNAGQNAAIRSLDDLLASGLAIRVATVPAPHDPDSYIKEFGGPAMQAVLDRAESFFEFYLTRLCKLNDITSDRGRMAVVAAMSEAVRKAANDVLTDSCVQRTAQRLGLSPDSVRKEFKKVPTQKFTPASEEEPIFDEATPAVTPPSTVEFWLLKLVFLGDEQIDQVAALVQLDWVTHPQVNQLVARRLRDHAEGRWNGAAALLSELEDESQRTLLASALADPRPIANFDQELKDVLVRLRNQFIDRQLTDVMQRMNAPDTSEEEKWRLMQDQLQLRNWKRQPLVA